MRKETRVGPSETDVCDLLKKLLVLQLFQLGLSQAEIGKRVRLDIHAVNGLLKGVRIRKPDGKR